MFSHSDIPVSRTIHWFQSKHFFVNFKLKNVVLQEKKYVLTLLFLFIVVYIIKTVTKSVEMRAYSYNINTIKTVWFHDRIYM